MISFFMLIKITERKRLSIENVIFRFRRPENTQIYQNFHFENLIPKQYVYSIVKQYVYVYSNLCIQHRILYMCMKMLHQQNYIFFQTTFILKILKKK